MDTLLAPTRSNNASTQSPMLPPPSVRALEATTSVISSRSKFGNIETKASVVSSRCLRIVSWCSCSSKESFLISMSSCLAGVSEGDGEVWNRLFSDDEIDCFIISADLVSTCDGDSFEFDPISSVSFFDVSSSAKFCSLALFSLSEAFSVAVPDSCFDSSGPGSIGLVAVADSSILASSFSLGSSGPLFSTSSCWLAPDTVSWCSGLSLSNCPRKSIRVVLSAVWAEPAMETELDTLTEGCGDCSEGSSNPWAFSWDALRTF
ncbi:hypothetical protein OGATHE_003696 [Ogataea polymorpha]|uniref:Uncharacterized protein n=1 Tax=Ogataea polymorpha TaxID=460523 RepID=A0A9P8T4I2_9ASCO|nr:hypothetical protein OGATHE_003696 [Ogataea polymorpha]